MIVTFETAIKLKAAGFPQPEPQRGQAWYFETWRQYQDGRDQELVWDAHWLRNNMHETRGGVVFAPTATDILRELGYDFSLSPLSDGRWFCDDQEDKSDAWFHESPAEACALAWLEKTVEAKKIPLHTIMCMTDSTLSIGSDELPNPEETKKIKVGTAEFWTKVKI